MGRIGVLGAGVIGQSYAAVLADAGHEVSIVARGDRAEALRERGLRVRLDGRVLQPDCAVVDDLPGIGPTDLLVVAVRGDQLPAVIDTVAAHDSPLVASLANPLGARARLAAAVGPERLVLAFSGIGGAMGPDGVTAHLVKEQPTTVDANAARGPELADLLAAASLPVRRETDMAGWLDTHTVFITGLAAAILGGPGGAARVAGDLGTARRLVVAMAEGFDALAARGGAIRPPALRAIFGRVPVPIAARYWKRQFARPMVTVSIEPHVLSTRDTEIPALVEHALALVGDRAPRYRELVGG